MVQRAGSYPEADDARAVLADLALADKRLDAAEDYMRQISERSSRRGEAELGVGQALWTRRNNSCGIQRLSTTMRSRPRSLSCERPGCSATVSPGAALTALRAIPLRPRWPAQILRWPKSRCFAAEPPKRSPCWKTAMRRRTGEAAPLQLLAYIAAGQLDKARAACRRCRRRFSKAGADSDRQLVQSCIRFQRLVARHLARYRERRMDEVLKQTVERLDAFLSAPAEGTAADDVFVSIFRAEALAGLAAGFDSGGPGIVPDARQRYRRATAAFQELLRRMATAERPSAI